MADKVREIKEKLITLKSVKPAYKTKFGKAYNVDALTGMKNIPTGSVDLVCTSPPFALSNKKKYGNPTPAEYKDWFWEFAQEFSRILSNSGSLVFEIGGAWIKGKPIRSLYIYQLIIDLCKSVEEGGLGFQLAQELYWYNPAKLPTPAEWVTIRRERVKDAVSTIWWLTLNDHPKANNRGVLTPYSKAHLKLLKNGYNAGKRPSEHVIGNSFGNNNNGAIPGNIIVAANTASNDVYLKECRAKGISPHPARFPKEIPEFAIKLCTEKGDLVFDPFAGSNMTGFIAEKLGRNWISFENDAGYVIGSKFRFNK